MSDEEGRRAGGCRTSATAVVQLPCQRSSVPGFKDLESSAAVGCGGGRKRLRSSPASRGHAAGRVFCQTTVAAFHIFGLKAGQPVTPAVELCSKPSASFW